MALEWVLHARYMTATPERGTNNYGGQDFGSNCIQADRQEQPFTSVVADASRNSFNYFSSAPILLDGGITGNTETGNGNKQAVNRAVNFMGKDYLILGDTIYNYSDASGIWVSQHFLTGKTATSTSTLGLYPVFVQNKPQLVTAWSVSNGATWRYAKLDGDTETWTTSSAQAGGLAINDTNGGILTEIQHGDRIYYTTSSEASFGYYDFVLDSFGTNSFGTTSRHPMDFASYMNDLYILNKNATDNVQILRVDATSTVFEGLIFDTGTPSVIVGIDVGDTLTTTSQFEGRPLFFVDNVYDTGNAPGETAEPTLWAYYATHASTAGYIGSIPSTTDTNHGLAAQPLRRVGGTGVLIGVQAPGSQPVTGFRANPFKMMHNQEGSWLGGFGAASRKDEDIILRAFIDQKDRGLDGTGRSSIICASRFAGQRCTGSPGGGGEFGNLFYHVFRGSGNTDGGNHPNPPTKDGGAHAFDFIGHPAKQVRQRAFPHGQLGGGARHSELDNDGHRVADIIYRGSNLTDEDGIIRISYSIIPSSGALVGGDVDIRWWYDIHNHAPESACTLVGTSDGAISGVIGATGLLVANVIVTEGKIYTVDWDAKGDGLQRYQRYTLNGQINFGQGDIVALDDPTDLNGLLSWFEANDDTTITSGVTHNVSEWRDKGTALSGLVQFNTSSQPTLIQAANNGLDGVSFVDTNEEFLFTSGSPITGQSATIFLIYEPSSVAEMTIFSMSDDNVSSTSSLTNHEYWSMLTHSTDSELRLRDFSFEAALGAQPVRELAVPSGGIADNTRLAVWRNTAFEGQGQLFPSGQLQETEWTTDGTIEATGLSNTTFGRTTGAQISGVYSPSLYYDGTIYEMAMYDRILADVEVLRFEKYAKAKYNLDD